MQEHDGLGFTPPPLLPWILGAIALYAICSALVFLRR